MRGTTAVVASLIISGWGLMSPRLAQATLIDVQFGSPGPTASTQYSGGAVIGSDGDLWNYLLSSSSDVPIDLEDTTGTATGLSLIYAAQGNYGLSTSAFSSTGYYPLMQSFLYTQGGPIQLTIQGLTVGQPYTLFIYGQSDYNSPDYGGTVTVNGDVQTALQNNYSTFVNEGNYLEFQGDADSNGDILISDAIASGLDQTMINGFQLEIDPVPEPASIVLLGSAIIGLGGAMRHRGRKA